MHGIYTRKLVDIVGHHSSIKIQERTRADFVDLAGAYLVAEKFVRKLFRQSNRDIDLDSIEEIVQDSIVRICDTMSQKGVSMQLVPKALLFTITRHAYADWVSERIRQPKPYSAHLESLVDYSTVWSTDYTHQGFQDLLDKIPSNCRELAYAIGISDSLRQACDLAGIPKSTGFDRLRRLKESVFPGYLILERFCDNLSQCIEAYNVSLRD